MLRKAASEMNEVIRQQRKGKGLKRLTFVAKAVSKFDASISDCKIHF